MRKRITAGLALLLCAALFWLGGAGRVTAAESDSQTTTLSGTVGLLKQDGSNYVMQVTVENSGEDFTGTVQVIFAGYSYDNCAYLTDLTLPAQGKKQFTINVPGELVEKSQGLCSLSFLDQKGRTLRSIELKNVLGDTMTGIGVGILSDDYSSLTYLDAGGDVFSIRGSVNKPLQLIELNPDNLREMLGGLYFLVIDQYNVASLGEENIRAIQEWTEAGGWLLIGTGAYAEQTLSGFSEDFLALEILGISEPGEDNIVSQEIENYGYYYNLADYGVDFTEIAVASLAYNSQHIYTESRENPCLLGENGDGSVAVFLFSLGEDELQRLDGYAVERFFEEVMYQSVSYTSIVQSDELSYIGQRALAYMDNQETDVDFTWLKILIAVYVVLVGPVLYLILRKCRKSEWYWVGVPVLGLLFIAGVFFFGRGARVSEPKVYSVTVQQADSSRKDTYLLAYQAGVKPWEIRLDESYDVAGVGLTGRNYWSYSGNTREYIYKVRNDGERLWIGVKPDENFQSGYLYAGGRTDSKGQLTGSCSSRANGSLEGTVKNETSCDLKYMAVMYDERIVVISDVKAGETVDLYEAVQNGRSVYSDNSLNYYWNLMDRMVTAYYTQTQLPYDRSDMAALLIGLGAALESGEPAADRPLAVGLLQDYHQRAAEDCKEFSYGCIYSYVDMRRDSQSEP
ncbi:MAG: hypothetical protein NC432_00695 [Roseburia sp.]|nr:hypothetical protein [Roseburia sp.]MCM1097339.1 hypothetical protein [Ruminococcus flavefaciens]